MKYAALALQYFGATALACLILIGLWKMADMIHEQGAEAARAEAQVEIDKIRAEIDRERMLVAAAIALVNNPGTIGEKATTVTLCAKVTDETGLRMTRSSLNGSCGEYGAIAIRFNVAYGPDGDRTVQAPVIVDGP